MIQFHSRGFRTSTLFMSSASRLLLKNVRSAPRGVLTIGSPFKLNDVFRIIGTPVRSPKVFMVSY